MVYNRSVTNVKWNKTPSVKTPKAIKDLYSSFLQVRKNLYKVISVKHISCCMILHSLNFSEWLSQAFNSSIECSLLSSTFKLVETTSFFQLFKPMSNRRLCSIHFLENVLNSYNKFKLLIPQQACTILFVLSS